MSKLVAREITLTSAANDGYVGEGVVVFDNIEEIELDATPIEVTISGPLSVVRRFHIGDVLDFNDMVTN